jgi:hypothetical protein
MVWEYETPTVPPGSEVGLRVIVGGGQGFGVQVVPAPCQRLGAEHADCVVTVQVAAGAQHAPVGCGQGFGEQVVAAPCQVFGAVQAA